MVSYSAKLDSRTKQHTQFGVSASNGSRDMARTKVAEKREKKEKKQKKNEHRQSHKASPTGIANEWDGGRGGGGGRGIQIQSSNKRDCQSEEKDS